jgi:hypothetical protein
VGTASPITANPISPSGESFLPFSEAQSKTQSNVGLPGLRINTKDLEIPDGSAGQVLTIRAQAL